MNKAASDGTNERAGWADGQVREFAKRFASQHSQSWKWHVGDVREALIDSFVLLIVLGQDREDVAVESIQSLRRRFAARLASDHRMPNPTADGL